MSRKTLLTLAVLTALSSATAFAASQSDSTAAPKPPRASLDLNGDGAIDKSEAAKSPRLAAKFAELDADKDGKLTRPEMRGAVTASTAMATARVAKAGAISCQAGPDKDSASVVPKPLPVKEVGIALRSDGCEQGRFHRPRRP